MVYDKIELEFKAIGTTIIDYKGTRNVLELGGRPVASGRPGRGSSGHPGATGNAPGRVDALAWLLGGHRSEAPHFWPKPIAQNVTFAKWGPEGTPPPVTGELEQGRLRKPRSPFAGACRGAFPTPLERPISGPDLKFGARGVVR
jgi:hypothetical protein